MALMTLSSLNYEAPMAVAASANNASILASISWEEISR